MRRANRFFCDYMRVFSEWATIQELSDIALPYGISGDLSGIPGDKEVGHFGMVCVARLVRMAWARASVLAPSASRFVFRCRSA
jgi:hypothetical protein